MSNNQNQKGGRQNLPSNEFKSRKAEKKSDLLGIATTDVISVPPTMSIIEGVQMMSSNNFRRLPITDPGNKKLLGIVTITDVIDLMGGGSRYNLVAKKHKGNLLSSLNDSLREIATEQVETLTPKDSISDAISMLVASGHGGFPIVHSDNTIAGIVTEYDIMRMLAQERTDKVVEGIMTKNPETVHPDEPISHVTKRMVAKGYRRLPVIKDDILIGVITATDVMGYLGQGKVFANMNTGTVDELLSQPVRDLMTSGDIKTTGPEVQIGNIAREMLAKGIGAFPVVEDGRVIGIITEFDLVKALAEDI